MYCGFDAGMLVYRVMRHENKLLLKFVHAVLLCLSLVFAIVGLKSVFDSHNLAKPKPIPNMYSLHSWLGLTAVVLFGLQVSEQVLVKITCGVYSNFYISLQWLCGFCSFLLPWMSVGLRSMYKPLHVFWGLAIFVFSVSAALMGFTEKSIFSK